MGKYKLSKADYDRALELNPKNTKNIKRKAVLCIAHGHLGEAVDLFQKCINLEPKDSSHNTDLNNVKKLLEQNDNLNDHWSKKNLSRSEEIAEAILKEAPEFTSVKLIYLESLLNNVKLDEAENFLIKRVNDEEKAIYEDFNFLLAVTYYYQGK